VNGSGSDDCEFCDLDRFGSVRLFISTELSYFAASDIKSADVLGGSGVICPRRHCRSPFDLDADEWSDLHSLLLLAKAAVQDWLEPDGFNLVWNVGPIAGQVVEHCHLHLIPRFHDEPLAERGARWHLKQPDNRRADPTAIGRGEAR
jgi:diadenosine tetraphosphate (Ap4A) HIT family hydrolase